MTQDPTVLRAGRIVRMDPARPTATASKRGKLALIGVLGHDPYAVDPARLSEIPILGTVHEGRWFPAAD